MILLRVHITFLLRKSEGKCKTHSYITSTNLLFRHTHFPVTGVGVGKGNLDNWVLDNGVLDWCFSGVENGVTNGDGGSFLGDARS